jgi:VWFA-related protein
MMNKTGVDYEFAARGLTRCFAQVKQATTGLLRCVLSISLLVVNVPGQDSRQRAATQDKNNLPTRTTKPAPKPETLKIRDPYYTAPVKNSPQKKEEEELSGETIKITSNLVAVPVSVTDGFGQPIKNLKPEDFRIEEDGKSQTIEFVGEPGKTPLEMVLLFDISLSVRERFEFEQQAVSRFMKTVLRPSDAAAIVSVGSVPRLALGRTTSLEKIIAGAMSLQPSREATAVFDSVVAATTYLKETAAAGTRRVIISISDGEDTFSQRYNLANALRELQLSDCVFYSINPSGPSIKLNKISMRGQSDLIAMSDITGGAAFLPERFEDLDHVFQQIVVELQAQYLLGYYPSNENQDGRFRKIAVRVPRRPELRVRSRQGYYSQKAQG